MSRLSPTGSQGPGVYLQHSAATRPISPAPADLAAFIGVAPNPRAQQNEPMLLHSTNDFYRLYLSEDSAHGDQVAVNQWTDLAYAVYGFFLNGGRRCYVINLGTTDGRPLAPNQNNRIDDISDGLEKLARLDDIAIVAAPGYTEPVHYTALNAHCEKLPDRLAILDPDMGAISSQLDKREVQAPVQSTDGFLTMYFPWLKVVDRVEHGRSILVPPSGYVAGVWVRTADSRGIHKAPANEIVRGILELGRPITDDENGMLNEAGINAIRTFPARGYLVWGARTLGGKDTWRYINARRLVNLLVKSIAAGTRWTVFEPPGEALWRSIIQDVSAFLDTYRIQGALSGQGGDQPFYVKCDAENNPAETREQGWVTFDIGLSGTGSDGFHIIRFTQTEAGTDIDWLNQPA